MFPSKKKLVLKDGVDLCDGRHCPEHLRETCYRYMLHTFYDVIARDTSKEVFWFVNPELDDNEKCSMWLPPQYQQ